MPSANSYAVPGTSGGNREDLRNILTILEPEATPATSMMRKGPSPKSTFVEVLADTLDQPRQDGEAEGVDIANFSNKATARQRFGSYIHKRSRPYAVTDIQQLISENQGVAAVADEYGYAKAKCMREYKRDIEAIVLGNQEMQQGDGDTGWKTRGLFKWVQNSAQSVNPVPSEFRTPASSIYSGTIGNFTEASLNGILQSMFEVYGERKSYDCVAGTELIETVDNFTRVQPSSQNQRYNVYEFAQKRQITIGVKIFDSSFGIANMIPDQFVNLTGGTGDNKAGLLLNKELMEMLFLEALHSVDLEDKGGGPRGYCRSSFALCVKNPRGFGKIAATS